jgi:hypothetical protein
MTSARQGLKRSAAAIGFSLVAVLLSALVHTGAASAACGPVGSASAKNTACGTGTLAHNTTGINDSAFGFNALYSNTTGADNTASGLNSLLSNTTGYDNTASGAFALFSNTMGPYNTASGYNALGGNVAGSYNIGFGFNAGANIVAGSNNIEIGGYGTSDESNTIRIGTQGTQTATYIAGVSGILSGGSEATELAVNTATGQVGVIPSSARFKRDIHDMGGASTDLMKLRPVTFRYKQDPQGQRQYGLIAEEVAKVYPELVVRGNNGEIESVQYRELIPLMLYEMQRQENEMRQKQQAALAELKAQDRNQQAALNELKTQNQMLQAALAQQNTALEARLERLEQTKTIASR